MGAGTSEPPAERSRGVGAVIAGRYRVLGTLGGGGMGSVYRVLDLSTGVTLALKEFGGKFADRLEGKHRLRFRLEFHTIARLRHPQIVRAFDYGVDGDVPHYTMEVLDGEDLGDLHDVSPLQACALLRDVASALALLHARRLIHRDLAPRNVRCTADGRAKLIDFGLLSTSGYIGDLAGTPPIVAPENVRGLPLDHRADIYSLGALAYWLLTGRHAYPARRIDELEALWKTRPLPPSAYSADIPGPLDALVLSMLSLDPLARPPAAAEVIESLHAVAGVAEGEATDGGAHDGEVARGYLASAALVGRQTELAAMKARLERMLAGGGGAAVLEGPSGHGKSRLLREIGLEAQVAGAAVVSASTDTAERGPYGLIRALAHSLLTVAPVEAKRAAQRYDAVLSRLVPEVELRSTLRDEPGTQGGATLEEERVRTQRALVGWILGVAAARPLLLLVDDVQRADEASAATLTALARAGRGARLLLVAALRTDEAVRASFAVGALVDAAERVRVLALDEPEVLALVRGTFGDVPHARKLASWMQKTSGGSPLHCFELARHLVERGVVRYQAGAWLVPEEPDVAGMPAHLAEAMAARVARLSPAARALAEVLSVHGGDVSLFVCVDAAGAVREEDLFAAVDELVVEEIIIGADDRYRVRHDALRETLLGALDEATRRTLHRNLGSALARGGVSPELEAEVGWHLYRGGERERGAALLERAGVRLYEAQSFRDAIPALEATLEVREAERAPVHRVLAIRHRLVMAGFFADRKVALRHAEESIAMLRRSCGMDTAAWLSRALPPLAALGAGMALATGRHWALGGGPAPRAALPTLYVEVAYLAVLRSFSFHIQEVRAHKVLLEPLRALRGRVPEAAYLTVTLTVAMPLGRFAEARVAAERSLEILRSDRRSAIPDADRATAMGAALMCLAFIGALEHDPHCLRLLVEVEALGLRYFDVSAEVVRTSYHRSRGEEELAVECEARVEQLLVQSGALWGPESQLVWMGALSYGGTRDLAGLRRSIGELSRLEADGFRVGGLLALTRGEYLRERGELVLARASLDEALAFVAPDDALVRVPALNGLAELALAERDPDRATSLAREALAIAESPAVRSLQGEARARRALALAHAARGDAPRARAVLDDTLARVAHLGSPSTSGALYEARARVAFDDGDAAACELDRQKADGLFRATRSSALVARAEALPHPVLAISRSPRRAHDAAADATMVEAAAAQGVADPTDGPGGLPAGAPTGGPGQRRSLRTGGD